MIRISARRFYHINRERVKFFRVNTTRGFHLLPRREKHDKIKLGAKIAALHKLLNENYSRQFYHVTTGRVKLFYKLLHLGTRYERVSFT